MNHVEKFLKKLARKDRALVQMAVDDIYARELGGYNLKKIVGKAGLYRIRLGRFRIIFYMDSEETILVRLTNRDDRTYTNL